VHALSSTPPPSPNNKFDVNNVTPLKLHKRIWSYHVATSFFAPFPSPVCSVARHRHRCTAATFLDQSADSSRHSRLTRWFTPFLLAISMALPSVKSRMLYVQKCRSHPPQLPPSTMWSPTHAVSAVRWMDEAAYSLTQTFCCLLLPLLPLLPV